MRAQIRLTPFLLSWLFAHLAIWNSWWKISPRSNSPKVMPVCHYVLSHALVVFKNCAGLLTPASAQWRKHKVSCWSMEKLTSRIFCLLCCKHMGSCTVHSASFPWAWPNLASHLLLVHWHPVVFFKAGQIVRICHLRLLNKVISFGSLSHTATYHKPNVAACLQVITRCISSPSWCYDLHLTVLVQPWHLSTTITSPHCGKRCSMESVQTHVSTLDFWKTWCSNNYHMFSDTDLGN